LADGFPEVPEMLSFGAKLCIGTDCNLRLSMAEELRWLEFGQRLKQERRGIVADAAGGCGAALFQMATVNGADALRLPAGRIAPGMWADLITLDLSHPLLAGCAAEGLLDGFILGCGNEPIVNVWVGGRSRVSAHAATE
jgi:formimidoylglutamate deiminase